MNCPFCGAEESKVVDSRPTETNSIRRRRECETCGKRFTTYEKIETIPMMVIKKNDMREPFDREKLQNGIYKACYKRPVSVADIDATIDRIEAQVLSRDEHEIKSVEIGEIVMTALRELDDVAYVRFASVYKEFKDVDTFLKEIEKIAKKGRK